MWRQYWAFVGNLLALKKRAGSKIGSVQTGVNEQCAQVCDILPVAPMLLLHNIWQFEWAHIHFQTLHCTQRETTASTYGSEIFRDTKSAAKSADLGTTRLNHRFVKVRHCKLVSQPAQTFGHSSYYIKNKFHSNALTSLVLLPIFFFFFLFFYGHKVLLRIPPKLPGPLQDPLAWFKCNFSLDRPVAWFSTSASQLS